MLYLIPQPESVRSPHDSNAEGKVLGFNMEQRTGGSRYNGPRFPANIQLYVLLTDSSLFFFSHFIANTNAPSPTPVGINTTIPINHNSCLLEALCDLENWKGSLKCWNRKPFDHKPPSYIPLHDEKQ